MEKELFLSTLKGKAQVDNLSDRTFDEVATLWLPQFADDTKITDESWVLPVQMLKTMSGQLRHDVSMGIASGKSQWENDAATTRQKAIEEAVANAKKEWERSNPAPAQAVTKPIEQSQDIDKKIAEAVALAIGGLTAESGAIGKLSKQFSDYMTQVAEERKTQTVESIRSQVRDYLVGRGADEDDFALEYTLEKMDIGDNPDLAALKTKAEADFEANYKRIHRNNGAHPFAGGAGGAGNGQDSKAEFDRFIQGKKAEMQKQQADADELKKLMM